MGLCDKLHSLRTWSLGVGKVTRALPRNSTPLSLHRSTSTYFLTTHTGSTRALVEALLARYPIKQKGTRNRALMQMIGDDSHGCTRSSGADR
jgi:hypothetical protein